MDKLKKFLSIPLAYHAALYLTMLIFYFGKSNASMMVATFELMLGSMVTPMFFAIMSMIHAIVHEAKVYDYIYTCLSYLGIIGAVRLVVYLLMGGSVIGALAAMVILVVSAGVFTLWDCLFALTDTMMKKRPKAKNKKK